MNQHPKPYRNALSVKLAEVTSATKPHILMKYCHNAAMVIENLEAEIEHLKGGNGPTSDTREEVQKEKEGHGSQEETSAGLESLERSIESLASSGQETGNKEDEEENRPLYHPLRSNPTP